MSPHAEIVEEVALVEDPEITALHEFYQQEINRIVTANRYMARMLQLVVKSANSDLASPHNFQDEEFASKYINYPCREQGSYYNEAFFENLDENNLKLSRMVEALERDCKTATDIRKMMKYVQSDDSMECIWNQFLTMMRMLEGADDK